MRTLADRILSTFKRRNIREVRFKSLLFVFRPDALRGVSDCTKANLRKPETRSIFASLSVAAATAMYFMSEAEFAASKSVDNQVVDERNQESSQTNLETACSFLKEEDLAANIQKISPGGFFVVERHNSSVGSGSMGNENRNFYTESSLLRKEPSVKVSRIEAIVASVNDADVLLLGECHDDSEAHCVELDVLQRCHTAWGGSRRLVLSLEMFERDVQPILDEYMCDAIAERDLLADARPWPNYADAYRPLVLFAKRHGIRVIAANAPRRYVSLVGTTGRDALQRIAASGSMPSA